MASGNVSFYNTSKNNWASLFRVVGGKETFVVDIAPQGSSTQQAQGKEQWAAKAKGSDKKLGLMKAKSSGGAQEYDILWDRGVPGQSGGG